MSAHQCPECPLRFASENELRHHLANDHPGRISEPPVHRKRP